MPIDNIFVLLEDAINSHHLIEFNYRKKNGRITFRRKGEPYEIRDGYNIFVYDLKRHSIRNFIIDRISNLKVLKQKFNPRF